MEKQNRASSAHAHRMQSSFVPVPSLPHAPPHAPPRRPRIRCSTAPPSSFSRRAFLAGLTGLAGASSAVDAAGVAKRRPSSATSSNVFSVIPTTVSDVNLLPVDIENAIADIATCDAVFLGEHHNSLVDHHLQARILQSLDSATGKKPLTVGLEMVQQRFQPVLDAYLAGQVSELDLYFETEWETRWVWPYESYLPVLRLCKNRKIPLIALSMDFETLSKLRMDGISSLTTEEIRQHVGDPRVFSSIINEPGFKAYINECVTPSYATHVRMGLLNQTANFNTFLTSRVLRDEAMATRAFKAIRENDGIIACLLGADHVKFEYGVPGRFSRQMRAAREREQESERLVQQANDLIDRGAPPIKEPRMRSVMLNPGPADAYDARDQSLKLEMSVGDTPIPISDYLWFSSAANAKPRRQVKKRLLPPVERLTRI